MKLSKKLKELRVENKVTQIQLSKELGISQATLCRYESGSFVPDAEAIKKYCEYFGVSADELLEIEK